MNRSHKQLTFFCLFIFFHLQYIAAQEPLLTIPLGKNASEKETGFSVGYNPIESQYVFRVKEKKNIYTYKANLFSKAIDSYTHFFEPSDSGYYKTDTTFFLQHEASTLGLGVIVGSCKNEAKEVRCILKGVNELIFTENNLNGSSWQQTETIKLQKRERILLVFNNAGQLFVLSFIPSPVFYFVIYEKKPGKPLIKRQYNVFPAVNNNEVVFPAQLLQEFTDYDRTFLDNDILENGESYDYTWLQDYIKFVINGEQLNILFNTNLDISWLLSFQLNTDQMDSFVFEYSRKKFEKQIETSGIPFKLSNKQYLNALIVNQCHIIDSTVIVARRMDSALLLIYYSANSGNIINSEVFDIADSAVWKQGVIVSSDSVVASITDNSYTPLLFYSFLKSSRPSVNLIAVDTNTIIMSIEVRDEQDSFGKKLLNQIAALSPDAFIARYGSKNAYEYNPRNVYSSRKVIAFARILDRKNFGLINNAPSFANLLPDSIKMQKINSLRIEKHMDDINTRILIHDNFLDLIYFNRKAGVFEVYRF